jgi:hypothetical protein
MRPGEHQQRLGAAVALGEALQERLVERDAAGFVAVVVLRDRGVIRGVVHDEARRRAVQRCVRVLGDQGLKSRRGGWPLLSVEERQAVLEVHHLPPQIGFRMIV